MRLHSETAAAAGGPAVVDASGEFQPPAVVEASGEFQPPDVVEAGGGGCGSVLELPAPLSSSGGSGLLSTSLNSRRLDLPLLLLMIFVSEMIVKALRSNGSQLK
jgi:hypothetical protein